MGDRGRRRVLCGDSVGSRGRRVYSGDQWGDPGEDTSIVGISEKKHKG